MGTSHGSLTGTWEGHPRETTGERESGHAASLAPTVTGRDARFQPFPQRSQGQTEGTRGPLGCPQPVHIPRLGGRGQGSYVTQETGQVGAH